MHDSESEIDEDTATQSAPKIVGLADEIEDITEGILDRRSQHRLMSSEECP